MRKGLNTLWIMRKDRHLYRDRAPSTGLRVRYADAIDDRIRTNLDGLVRYLRRFYFFPVRCNVYVTNHSSYQSEYDGHKYYGVFYNNEGIYKKKKLYPEIYVAGKVDKLFAIERVMFLLLHELSHYYQWIGDREKGRTDRSIESEATRWANRILEEYKQYCSIQTPFGELNIYVDGRLINYLPIRISYDHPTCQDKPLAACYRIYGAIKTGQTVRAVIEPLADCDVSDCSGEDYVCCEFERDTVRMTLGTWENCQVTPIENGLQLASIQDSTEIYLGLAWVNDAFEYDNRTWFAADPTIGG